VITRFTVDGDGCVLEEDDSGGLCCYEEVEKHIADMQAAYIRVIREAATIISEYRGCFAYSKHTRLADMASAWVLANTGITDVTTNGGLLYRDGKLIDLPEADLVARDHGYIYAEQLVKALAGKAGA
jgi:hypothetical protein